MILEMTKINKAFYGVPAIKDISFNLEKGETHALLGENGAGKSTLMNILGGVYEKDSGSIILDGKEMTKITTKSAIELGIAFVHQELNLFNDLKVYENIFLREEITNRFGHLNKKEMIEEVKALLLSLGVEIDPEALVGDLDTSKKQMLEIVKALRKDAKIFILDEPTTALGNQEIDNLFSIINRLKKQGKSFIFISHKMPEIFRIADRYTVLRNGELVGVGKIANISPEDITRLMVGESYDNGEIYRKRGLLEPVLEMCDFSGPGFNHINLEIHKGEIFGFTGLQGAGCSELLQCIFGVTTPTGGELKVFGKTKAKGIHRAMKNKIGMIAANRKENSIVPDMTLLENAYISEHTLSVRNQLINKKYEIEKYNKLSKSLNVKANHHDDLIVGLSGGNQQKIILARWLNTEAEILLLDNPTQGIDVGAKNEIYKLILELSEKGKTILINTLEIAEIQKISDRCAVFYHSNLQVVLDRKEISEEKVMLYATNAINISEGQNGEKK